ncbi:hypothetical protein EJB05_42963, partial [Eragrostis curvula]
MSVGCDKQTFVCELWPPRPIPLLHQPQNPNSPLPPRVPIRTVSRRRTSGAQRRRQVESMEADGGQAPNPAPPAPPVQLPSYPEMILEAIDALDNENGSNKTAISGYLKRKYGSSLPTKEHASFLTAHLARMKTTGELAFSRNNYFRPDDDEEEEEEEPSEAAPADPSSTRGQDPEPDDTVSDSVDPDDFLAPDPVLTADVDDVPAPAQAVADVVTAPAHAVADPVPAPAPVVAAADGAVPVKRGRGRPPKPKTPVVVEPDVAAIAVPVVADDADGVPAAAPAVVVAADADAVPEHAVEEPDAAADADGVPAPATLVAADAVAEPAKRGRGRPPKPKDPVAEATVIADDANAVPVKRGRGRPPKPKDPVAEAVAVATSGMPRARGRPPKKAKVALEAPVGSSAPATIGAADADAVPVKRGRGRPPKVKPPVDG